ncbi:MAG: hypothetical protein VX466_15870 [Myxococcota bacterium]|nr:hypothetical protein [Myxococcota bacterium]
MDGLLYDESQSVGEFAVGERRLEQVRFVGHPLLENHGRREFEGVEDPLVDLSAPYMHHADEADLAVGALVVAFDEVNPVSIDLDEAASRQLNLGREGEHHVGGEKRRPEQDRTACESRET